jgi:hypothetical protein
MPTSETGHKFAGMHRDDDPPRLWRASCECGVQVCLTDKDLAWDGIARHFVETPEFQALLARQRDE